MLLLAALLPCFANAQDDTPTPWRQTNLAFVAAATTRNQDAAAKNADLFVRRGLLADRKERTVRLWAEATGIEGKETEFFLISERSGHDYEALAVAFAQPGDVRDALVFIGMTPGKPVDFRACRFWPKGERVRVIFNWTPPSIAGEPVAPRAVPAELLIFDKARKAPLPADGFVFTASRRVPLPQDPTQTGYAADLFDPHSIASTYNDPDTILDVPRQASKSAVYGWQVPNPDHRFGKGQLVEVLLLPERRDGSHRVRDLSLRVAPGEGANAPPRFTLTGLDAPPVFETRDVGALLGTFQSCTNRHQDPFVSFLPDPSLPLDQVRLVCAFLEMAENRAEIRMEPPAEGHLYYRAFLPDEKYRDRANWIVKPWELDLTRTAQGATGVVTTVAEKWEKENSEPALIIDTHPAASPEALRAFLAARKIETPVLVIHAPASLSYDTLSAYARAILSTHPTVWVFLK
jgi:hypothetical protein